VEKYIPEQPTDITDVKDLVSFIVRENRRIAVALDGAMPSTLTELNAAPAKPRNYMVVAADGTNWNPGSGKGAYIYYSSAWHFLG